MILLPDTFVVLGGPVYDARGFGFYVASVEQADTDLDTYWYLHDDGECRDYCGQSPTTSQGYFLTIEKAWSAAVEFYDHNNMVYPYTIASDGRVCNLDGELVSKPAVVSTKIESEVMEF